MAKVSITTEDVKWIHEVDDIVESTVINYDTCEPTGETATLTVKSRERVRRLDMEGAPVIQYYICYDDNGVEFFIAYREDEDNG